MPRVHHVKKARKKQGTCSKCGKPIEAGDPYKWFKRRFSGKTKCCANCGFTRADMTSSDKLAQIYSIADNLEAELNNFSPEGPDDFDSLQSVVEDAAQEIRDVAEEYRESAQNIREHFQDSPTADECEERAEEIEAWADEIEGAAGNIDPSVAQCETCDGEGEAECESCNGDGRIDCDLCGGGGDIHCEICGGAPPDCESCEECGDDGMTTCPDCKGENPECDDCGATGMTECENCGGSGTKPSEELMEAAESVLDEIRGAAENCPV